MESAFRILIVCTGNICRSPFAEGLLRRELEYLSPGEFLVSSAGTQAIETSQIHPEIVQLANRAGLSLDGHVPRQLSEAMVANADLVIGMDRTHRREIVQISPKSLKTTFTLREFARILPNIPADQNASPADRWRLLVAKAPRYRSSPSGPAIADDVVDPYGRPSRVFAKMTEQITSAVATIVDWETDNG